MTAIFGDAEPGAHHHWPIRRTPDCLSQLTVGFIQVLHGKNRYPQVVKRFEHPGQGRLIRHAPRAAADDKEKDQALTPIYPTPDFGGKTEGEKFAPLPRENQVRARQ